jgi:phage N-6-adenine-methyltransferase
MTSADAALLFHMPEDSVALTSDDCYTPRWVFDAMGLHFDIDVAAPVGGPWHVPCDRYFTAADDGLAQEWGGALVWCNPPYSNYTAWANRFAVADRVALMGIVLPEVLWFPTVFRSADALALIFVAFRGVGIEPAARLAAADRRYGAALCPLGEAS